jgi:hypothetical protein
VTYDLAPPEPISQGAYYSNEVLVQQLRRLVVRLESGPIVVVLDVTTVTHDGVVVSGQLQVAGVQAELVAVQQVEVHHAAEALGVV